jgi:hypothetical protein
VSGLIEAGPVEPKHEPRLLIPITSEESQKYIDIYKNTEDKDSLWFYIK